MKEGGAPQVAGKLPAMGPEGAALTGELPVSGRGGALPQRVKGASAPASLVPPVAAPESGKAPASNGAAPAAWSPSLPTEFAARAAADAASQRYRPANPHAPMIGSDAPPATSTPTPIFDSISAWFTSEPSAASSTGEVERVVDLRDGARPTVTTGGSSAAARWAALGDQQWLAASARAAATPEISGTTDTGLPMRRPGANLVPSAAAAVQGVATRAGQGGVPAPLPPAPVHKADPEAVRGRLGSYQRGLTSARRSRRAPGDAPSADQLFSAAKTSDGADRTPERTGGDT